VHEKGKALHRLLQPVRALVLLALPVAWLGCQSLGLGGSSGGEAGTDRPPAPGRLARILESGELRVGISGDLAPLNMKNKSGEIIGLEVDIVSALAHAMGLEIVLVETPFPKLIDRLLDGQVDLVISAMTMTPQRNARVAFVGPYFISGTSVLTKNDDIALAQEPEELNVAGRKFAALEGSTSAAFVREVLPETTLVETEAYDAAVKMVIDGQVDGLVADFQKCMVSTWQYPDSGLQAVRTPFTIEPLGIALPPDEPLLMNLVTNYLRTLEDTGLLTQLKAKWLSDGSWLSELP
jgi:polar amino acid transport system substrate-binding protein